MSELEGGVALDGAATPRPAAGLVTIDVDGELIVLDPRADRISQLDRVGSIIWSVLDGEVTVDELVDDLAAAFETPPEVVREDLASLLDSLERVGLLEGSEAPSRLWTDVAPQDAAVEDGLWRPDYLVDPPAP